MNTASPLTKAAAAKAAETHARLVAEAKTHTDTALAAARTGCEHALLAGMRLVALHAEEEARGARNDFVPRGTKLKGSSPESAEAGFRAALAEIGLPKSTAYRWMNAANGAAMRLGLEEMPTRPSDPEWKQLEKGISKLAQGMSLNRLAIGAAAASSDEHRQDELITRAEEGDAHAEAALERIAAGEMTLVQAMRAAAGALATKEKERKDPVYLTLDSSTGSCSGLFVKSLTTIRNTFRTWDQAPEPARKRARELWLQIVAEMPEDLRR